MYFIYLKGQGSSCDFITIITYMIKWDINLPRYRLQYKYDIYFEFLD